MSEPTAAEALEWVWDTALPARDCHLIESYLRQFIADHTESEAKPEGEACECERVPGVILAMDTATGIQRCDECARYPGDLEAALAAATLVGGSVRFLGVPRATPDVEPTERTYTGPLSAEGWFIADDTNPWVILNGAPFDWDTYERGEVAP